MVAEFSPPRLKREDCKRTKHDSNFSKWEILVAASDWEDYSLGKEGAERYRIHNLPKISGPGLYELGIAISHSGLGREIAKLDGERIVVVYLGEADNVRTRLQHYGRSGSHLGNGYLCINDCKIVSLEKGPGLFQEIFLRGYSIVYRWAPMQNKLDAQLTEVQLLRTFDYAWNTSGNGARRHNDVLEKLEDIASRTSRFTTIARKLLPFRQKQLGIKIKTIKLLPVENKPNDFAEESNNFLSGILNFSRSRPRSVVDSGNVNDVDISTCGVTIGYGMVCRKPPVEGRKRCAEHKGIKNGSIRNSSGGLNLQTSVGIGATIYGDKDSHGGNAENSCNTAELSVSDSFPNNGRSIPICGFSLYDGSPCGMQPVQGRKRCEEHKGQRIRRSILTSSEETESKVVLNMIINQDNHAALSDREISPVPKPEHILITSAMSSQISVVVSPGLDKICGVDLGNGLSCTRQPVKGRVRCGEHKGMRTNGLVSRLALATRVKPNVSDTGSVC